MKKEKYEEAPKIKGIAEELISKITELGKLKRRNPKIKYLYINKEKSSFLGQCCLTNGIWRYLSDFDYVILIWKKFAEISNETFIKAVILHELCHVVYIPSDTGDGDWRLKNHDVEEFSLVIKQYGLYDTTLQTFFRVYNRENTAKELSKKEDKPKEKLEKGPEPEAPKSHLVKEGGKNPVDVPAEE